MMESDNGPGPDTVTTAEWEEGGAREPLAVVGLACRFPGAPDAETFWRMLCEGKELLREVPADRWDASAWHDADPRAEGRMVTRHGYFLDGVRGFDPLFFGISPREAGEMDPQQRLMLEMAWEALEDAGLPPLSLKGSRTGVFMGSIWHDYADRHLSERAAVTLHSATGQSLNIVANRLSYVLGLKGPSLTVDTACSSSLVAVHLACQSLRSGESRLALVGGVNLMFSPEANVLLSKFGGLSPDGRSKAFAAGADGFGRGEGAGLVVLQPLSAALAAGARIYCVIRGSAVNNNGLGNGLTAPSVPGQAALLREAYARAGVPTNRVHYVETHGTGTALGDPTEASALGAALGEGRAIDRPLLIGSLKANIGHLEGAAGIAGVIKVALALSRRLVPPHLLHGEPNPRIPFGELRLSLPRHALPWPGEDEPATAGVSAFGWGGTNAHVVFEEAPVGAEELLPLAADTAEELLAQAARAEELVLNRAAPVSVRDLSRTWALHTGQGGHRAAMSFRTRAELSVQLKSLRQGKRRAGLSTGEPGDTPRVAFVCAPQGSEWPGMGRELLATEPVFRARVEALDTTFMPLAGWSLVERLREPQARQTSEEDAEPLAFALQVGLAALWRSWGVEPEAVVGHGVGEVVAACIAGALDASDAVWKVYRASRLHQWEPLRDELEAAQLRLWDRQAEGERGPRWLSTLAREVGPDGRLGEARCRTPRQPVRFAQATERLVTEGVNTFVELSPHPVLCRPVEQLLRKAVRAGVVVGSLRRDEPRAALLEALGALHSRGVRVRWSALPPPETPVRELPTPTRVEGDSSRLELLALSAQTPEALARTAHLLLGHLEQRPLSLHDVCYSASVHRGHLHYRLALRARTLAEARAGLGAFLRTESRPGLATTRHADGRHQPVVFVFPGQGSQWAGMGRRLMQEEPVFRAALEHCDEALRRHVDWSLLELLSSEAQGWMERVDQVQPALFSIQVALARLWRSWGVVPDGVVGHSMGEVAAAHVAGALSLDDAARIICRRSLLLRRVSGQGGMAMVELTLEEARTAIAGLEDWLSVAASNSPRSTVLSGEPHALGQVLDALEARQVFCRRVKVDVASHSPQMEPLREDLLHALEGLSPRRGEVPLYSTVTGQVMDGAQLEPAYWVRNLREPVLLSPVVERLAQSGHSLFVEISPHPVLLPSIEQTLAHVQLEGTVLPSMRREQPEREVLLDTLGGLYAVGHEVAWKALFPEGGRQVRLPDYPWQRQDCWMQPGAQPVLPAAPRDAAPASVLGAPRRSSLRPGAFFWDVDVGLAQLPWLGDHKVQGAVLLPTTAYLDWVMTAVQSALGPGPWVLEEMRIDEALALLGDSARRAELLVDVSSTGAISFKVSSYIPTPGGSGAEMWTVHAGGRVRALDAPSRSTAIAVEALQRRLPQVLIGEAHYLDMEQRGLQYGPGFQGVQEVWRADGEALGRIVVPERLGKGVDSAHPGVLDAALQVLLEALPADDTTFVPVHLRRYELVRRGTPRWAHARVTPRESWRKGASLEGDVVLADAQGQVLAVVEGLELAVLPSRYGKVRAEQDRSLFEVAWRRAGLPAVFEPGSPETPWLVFQDAGGVGAALADMLESWGGACVRVEAGAGLRRLDARHYTVAPGSREDLSAVVRQCFPEEGSCAGVVYLWGLDAPEPEVPGDKALDATLRACAGALRLVQEVARWGWRDPPRLWLVTRGAWPVLGSPTPGALQAALWGLGRTVGQEHPELRCTCVDLDPSPHGVDVESLGREFAARAEDEQVALRSGTRLVARLVRRSSAALVQEPLLPVAGRGFQVETAPASSFGGVVVRMAERRRPGRGEVEIQVEASALNFIDVMKTMGLYVMKDAGRRSGSGVPLEGLPLGLDCAGRVVAVGEGVTSLAVGDEVVAFAPAAMASHVVVDARFVARRPAGMSVEEAASIPSVFMTAWYAFHHLARLGTGERVLIHSAAGGLGLAAVQIASALGAEVFATAGTPEKRELLRSMGIRHVMDSHTLAFADEVMRLTNGEGVDVVLNSLSGDALTRSMEVLAPDGRFLEVGNRDIHGGQSLDLSQFSRRLMYVAIHLGGLRERRPDLCARLLHEVMERMESGMLRPVQLRAFPVSQVSDAFREMARGQHVGKLVVTLQDTQLRVVPPKPGFRVRPDASYLITGGLGGLGLAAARWLVGHGARCLVLSGRGEPSESALAELDALRATGVRVEVARLDVADVRALAHVVARTHGELPRLRGVLHCAGVLADGTLEQQDPARFRDVLTPKVQGAWNLHTLTRDESLDFFVLYSSMAGLLGMPGQGNYAAANAALDALAHHRRQQGLPALSINWGPFAEVGLAAAHANRGERLAYQGMASFTTRQGDALLERLLAEGATHAGAVQLDLRQWLQFFPSAASQRVWEELAQERQAEGARSRSSLLVELKRCAPGGRQTMLENYLRERLSQVVRVEPARIGRHEPFRGLGLDSLMSLELRNRIEAALDLKLSVTLLWARSTLMALASYLLEQLGLAPVSEPAAPAAPAERPRKEKNRVAPAPRETPREAPREAVPLTELTEGQLLELADDALAGWEDAS